MPPAAGVCSKEFTIKKKLRLRLSSIVNTVTLISLIIFYSVAFANGPAPLNDEKVVREIKGKMAKLQQAYLKEKGNPETGINKVLFLKKIQEEAFAENGYEFFDTLSKMANEGFNKEDRLVTAFRIPDHDRNQRIIEIEPGNLEYPQGKSENFATIEMTVFPGRSIQAKKALYQEIVSRLHRLEIQGNDILIVLNEPPLDNWGIRGG